MLNNKFKEVLNNLEQNISNTKDTQYAKSQITELTLTYLEELGKIEETYDKKLSLCEERIDDLEQAIEKIESEIAVEDDETDYEPINCPYCNTKFIIEFDSRSSEVRCPDCKNIIKLDWENFDDDIN